MGEKRISVEELKQTIDAAYLQTVNTVWHGIPVVIRKHLSLDDSLAFVENTVASCFASDTGEYLPEIKDFMVRCAILSDYANFDLPDDIDERFEIVYSTELVHFISEYIDSDHLHAMLAAIDQKLEYRAASRAEELTEQVNNVINGFEDLEKSMSDLFGGVDSDTIMSIAGAVANEGFNEEKLASAAFALNNKKEDEE